jgi:hypothetical protein
MGRILDPQRERFINHRILLLLDRLGSCSSSNEPATRDIRMAADSPGERPRVVVVVP